MHTKLQSTDKIKTGLISQDTGSAIIFLVDGASMRLLVSKTRILAITFMVSASYSYVYNNYGQVIQQDKSLNQLKMGGDSVTLYQN